ncbi:MAG: efflux RND transporter permease subunit [Planctomycetes bacterium]|nr:efflux RND transporter permease subunit [Planctomycetota bacterium]
MFLGDIAEISLDHLPREEYFRTSAADGVQLSIRKQPGHNTVEINQKIKEKMVRIKKALPASISIAIQSDQSKQIIGSIGSVATAAWQGGLLAVFILLLFLRNISSTLIISVAIPLSVLATFSLMKFAGITMNMVSLMGITLVIALSWIF